jgi:DNA-binding SARP family transcriptional activator
MSRLVRPNKQSAFYVVHPAQPGSGSDRREPSRPAGHVKMSLFGSFHVEGPNGEDLTPRGQKARALLALVATAKRGQRSRTWLCAKLWSDRGTEQAYASLRQALMEIRKAFGPYSAGILLTDQFNVSLDLANMAIDAVELREALLSKDGLQQVDIPGDEFLEGLNVGDEEFEEWLTIERSRWVDVKDELDRIQPITPAPWLAARKTVRIAASG